MKGGGKGYIADATGVERFVSWDVELGAACCADQEVFAADHGSGCIIRDGGEESMCRISSLKACPCPCQAPVEQQS